MVTTQSTKLENLLRTIQPCQFASYQEFMRALQIEALSNSDFTFDQLNYNLYASFIHHVERATFQNDQWWLPWRGFRS